MSDARDSLRRIRSAGDMPAPGIRSPEVALFLPSRHSESHVHPPDPIPGAPPSLDTENLPPAMSRSPQSAGLIIEGMRPPAPPPILEQQPAPIAQPVAPLNTSMYSRTMRFFGHGRTPAARARKLLVSLWYNLAWGFVQVVMIISLLSVATHTESKTMPGMNEWDACDRPLGAWACIYVVRVAFSSGLSYWGYTRNRKLHANADDTETARNSATPTATTAAIATVNPTSPAGNAPPSDGDNPETPTPVPVLPHTVLYSRLSILSTLVTLTWFLTAHILEYTTLDSCRFSSPHLWWLIFGVLCIMYLVVLEVVVLGVIVFVIAPILFLFWNIFLMCLGRHPLQNPTAIKPDIDKLSASVVDQIPLVMYIPPPPDATAADVVAIPQPIYSYPPKSSQPAVQPRRRFKFLRRRGKKGSAEALAAADVPERKSTHIGEPQTWQDHWEHTGYPFVVLEGNRAACAICLGDFEEPKRIIADRVDVVAEDSASSGEKAPETPAILEVPVAHAAEDREDQLRLEDAGEGAQPLRLLACGHVFHKTCLDPWLTGVSGRCPVCQRAVELPAKRDKKSRTP